MLIRWASHSYYLMSSVVNKELENSNTHAHTHIWTEVWTCLDKGGENEQAVSRYIICGVATQ